MGKLSDDESKLFEELKARLEAPDEDDSYEVEIYDTNAGKGARVPFRSAKNWLFDTFGIGEAPASAAGEGGGEGSSASGSSPSGGKGKAAAPKAGGGGGSGYFGRQS